MHIHFAVTAYSLLFTPTKPLHLYMGNNKSTNHNLKQTKETMSDKDSSSPRKEPTIDSIVNVGKTRFLALNTLEYTDAKGVKRKWDCASRTTKQSMDKADAVVIIPILRSSKSDTLETILVQQFRPPMRRVTLEFPAGLIDEGETPVDAALRELKEETGYVGTPDEEFQSMLLCMSPGLCDESINMIVVNIDLDQKENQNPTQMLDEGEDILLKRVDLFDGLKEAMKDEKQMPVSMLYSFVLGLELGRKLK